MDSDFIKMKIILKNTFQYQFKKPWTLCLEYDLDISSWIISNKDASVYGTGDTWVEALVDFDFDIDIQSWEASFMNLPRPDQHTEDSVATMRQILDYVNMKVSLE